MAARVTMKWYGDRCERGIRTALENRLAAVGEFLADEIQGNISTQGPPASVPGEFPHKDTGELFSSIYSVINRRALTVRVVATAPHAKYVEASRPFIRRTLFESRAAMRRIMLGAGISRGRFKFS
jgi:hypothetical protein